jgi:hypothetical protein
MIARWTRFCDGPGIRPGLWLGQGALQRAMMLHQKWCYEKSCRRNVSTKEWRGTPLHSLVHIELRPARSFITGKRAGLSRTGDKLSGERRFSSQHQHAADEGCTAVQTDAQSEWRLPLVPLAAHTHGACHLLATCSDCSSEGKMSDPPVPLPREQPMESREHSCGGIPELTTIAPNIEL